MASPAGYKTWSAGEVLQASELMSYLMDQSVLVFSGTAAAGSALASPAEGQLRFLRDTDSLEYYSGSAWQTVGGGDVGFEQTFLLMGA